MQLKVTTDSKSKLMQDIEAFVLEETNELLEELYVNIANDTPVDEGEAARSWQLAERVGRIGQTGYIGNDEDYIIYLEDGSSDQAPSGFIRINIIKSLNNRK